MNLLNFTLKYFLLFMILNIGALFAQEPAPSEKTVPCPVCKETGDVDCHIPKCDKGSLSCPKPCLKPTEGEWIKMDVKGHPDSDVWRKFELPGGGWQAFNQKHYGELIDTTGKKIKSLGKCPTCKGRMMVKCDACRGKGITTCWACDGDKQFIISAHNSTFLDEQGIPDPSLQLSIKDFSPRKFPYVNEFIAKLYSKFEERAFEVEKKQTFKLGASEYTVLEVFNVPGKQQEVLIQKLDSKKTFKILPIKKTEPASP